ncbi:MAG: ThuA domain-containing protein [Chloroherpetonaceae bacterium]|nr:ThuA domain-containing protein [Chloroherpetonaceae bacterium]
MKRRFALTAGFLLLAAVTLTACLSSDRRVEASPGLRGEPQTRNRRMKNVLVVTVTKGFRHDSIPVAEETIKMLGERTGAWITDFARTDADIQQKMTPQALQRYDAVIFANTTGVLPLPDPPALLEYVRSGKGFVAMHAGSDTFHTWPGSSAPVSEYIQMLGGEFLTHGAQCAVDGHILDPKHPATIAIVRSGERTDPATAANVDLKKYTVATGKIWKVFDEIYILKNVDRVNLRALVVLDRYPPDGSPNAGKPGEHLISWCRTYGRGRVFYTALGHRQEVWRDPLFQEHIAGGIQFALGLMKGETRPNPEAAPAK